MELNNRNPKWLRVAALLLLLLLAAVLWISGVFSPFNPDVRVSREFITVSNYDFYHEHWKEEKLAQLRDAENYKNLSASGEWEFLLNLCDWTHRQWEWSKPDPYPLCNAMDILREIRAGRTGGFCGQYAFVLADALKSMGFFNVRYVELWSDKGGGRSHFVVEVWSDQWEKWVMLDADYNIYYVLAGSGTPANALEIRAAYYGGAAAEARPVKPGATIRDGYGVDLYAHVAVSLRSDLMRHVKPLTVGDRFDMFLFYRDERSNPAVWGGKEWPYLNVTTRKEDLYYECNALRAAYEVDAERQSVELEFFTDRSMPHFRQVIFSVDNGASWRVLPGARLTVKKQDGPFRGIFVPVNVFGGKGRSCRVEIDF